LVGPPFYATFLKTGGGRATEGQKPLPQNRLWCLQGHASTKPPGRSWRPPSVSSHGRQAGPFLLEVCRVRHRPCYWGGHLRGQTVSQLHQSTSQTPPRTPRNRQSPSNSRPPNLHHQIRRPSLLPSITGPSNGSLRMTPDALPPFQQGQIEKSTPFGCSSGSLQPKVLPTPTWLRPLWGQTS
jgi:hypothetical protein